MQSITARIASGDLTTVILFVVCFILLGSLIISFVYRPEEYQRTRLSVFLSSLASVAIFLVSINIVISSYSFEYNQEFIRLSKTREAIDKLWLYPNQLLVNSRHLRPEFVAGFYMNNLELYQSSLEEKNTEKPSAETIIEEQYVAIVILQAWEDFLTVRKFDETGPEVWLNNFLQWAQNPYLKHYFKLLKYNYKQTTIELAEILFDYAAKLPVPTVQVDIYRETVKKIVKDPRFIRLLN